MLGLWHEHSRLRGQGWRLGCVCVFGLAELPCLTSLVLSLFLGSVVGMLFPFVVVLLFLLCHACWLAFLLLSSLHRSLAHPQSLKTKMY